MNIQEMFEKQGLDTRPVHVKKIAEENQLYCVITEKFSFLTAFPFEYRGETEGCFMVDVGLLDERFIKDIRINLKYVVASYRL